MFKKNRLISVILASLAAGLLTVVIPVQASAAKAISCKTSKSVAHTPMVFAMPKVDKNIGDKIVTLRTNCGDIVFKAFGSKAPTTVSVFKFLAGSKYFDKSPCHRLVDSGLFVLQCGDPSGSGMGNPGFKFIDENLPKYVANNYPRGTVAMANAGPGTNGSQFFLVYADTTLPANYTIFGQVTKGLSILEYIAKKGTVTGGSDGSPKQPVFIEKVFIK